MITAKEARQQSSDNSLIGIETRKLREKIQSGIKQSISKNRFHYFLEIPDIDDDNRPFARICAERDVVRELKSNGYHASDKCQYDGKVGIYVEW